MQIGRVKGITQPETGDTEIELTWFYRPEEAVGGRKVGNHRDVSYLASLFKHLHVHVHALNVNGGQQVQQMLG